MLLNGTYLRPCSAFLKSRQSLKLKCKFQMFKSWVATYGPRWLSLILKEYGPQSRLQSYFLTKQFQTICAAVKLSYNYSYRIGAKALYFQVQNLVKNKKKVFTLNLCDVVPFTSNTVVSKLFEQGAV